MEFPKTLFRLTPSFVPKPVTVVALRPGWGTFGPYYETESGARLYSKDSFETEEEAYAAAFKRLEDFQKRIEKQIHSLEKKRAAVKAAYEKR